MTFAARACPACLAADARPHPGIEGRAFVRCGACGSLYQAAPASAGADEAIYQSDDYVADRGHAGDPAVESAKRATALDYLALLERHTPPGRRYLEVGCSAGAALAAAAAAGWDAHGIELSAGAADLARTRPGVRSVHAGTVLDAPFGPGAFDVITLFDVIEHIDPPDPTLARIAELLSPRGLVLFVTPDGASASAMIMGSRWPHLFAEHLVCYSENGLTTALGRAALRVERSGFAWKRVNLDMLARHARVHPGIAGGPLIRALAGLPTAVRSANFRFNIGEFWMLARKA